MEKPTFNWWKHVVEAIKKLQSDYHQHRGMLLTEGDLECQLFRYLMLEAPFSGYHRTQYNGNRPSSGYIHSQVTWFKPDQLSGFKVDLTVLEPSKLNVRHYQNEDEIYQEDRKPSKGFFYDGPSIGIELKFIRRFDDLQERAIEDYKKIQDMNIAMIFHRETNLYADSTAENTAFFSVVGCKNQQYYFKAVVSLDTFIQKRPLIPPTNIYVCVFYQDEILWFPNAEGTAAMGNGCVTG